MITEQHGNLLQADAEAFVNTVNIVGVMGKGIALQFKRGYPENYKAYERACKLGEVQLGRMFVVPVDTMTHPKYIINFPTKKHWRARSKLDDIRRGLDDLVQVVKTLDLRSLALPPLGCGNGGLAWVDVYPLIQEACSKIPQTHVLLFPPEGAPEANEMPVRTHRPKMTRRRAAMLLAFEQYVRMSSNAGQTFDDTFSLVEAQKIAYFLQKAGWPAAFKFVPGIYGPYAPTVDQWLSAVEGHYITGFGDGTTGSQAVLRLDEGSLTEARKLMDGDTEFEAILDRFEALVYGFESPYGIELLSTVHYIMASQRFRFDSVDSVIDAIGLWSDRKKRMFRPRQVNVAYDHLTEVGAFTAIS